MNLFNPVAVLILLVFEAKGLVIGATNLAGPGAGVLNLGSVGCFCADVHSFILYLVDPVTVLLIIVFETKSLVVYAGLIGIDCQLFVHYR